MIHQPVEIEQPLIDHVLAGGAFVFENRRAVVFVQPKRVDTPGVGLAGRVFAGEKADAEQRFEMFSISVCSGFSRSEASPCSSEAWPWVRRNNLMSLMHTTYAANPQHRKQLLIPFNAIS